MAVDKSIPVPLFTEMSVEVGSPFFHIFPGEVALVQGFGFQQYKTRVDNTERQVPQVACLEMLIFKEGVHMSRPAGTCAIMDLEHYKTELLAMETMRLNGCTYSISKKNNVMLLNIPGSYRFVMNDDTALGNARIFLRVFTKIEFPWNSPFLIGGTE